MRRVVRHQPRVAGAQFVLNPRQLRQGLALSAQSNLGHLVASALDPPNGSGQAGPRGRYRTMWPLGLAWPRVGDQRCQQRRALLYDRFGHGQCPS